MKPVIDEDLYGNAPDSSPVVLLMIDMMNDFEFPGGDDLFEHALPMAERLAALKEKARAAGIPTVYVNDNFGKWRSDLTRLIQHCLDDDVQGQPIARLLRPSEEDYIVLKPKLSGFYCTALELLLIHLGARELIITGVATNSCVLFTASDAYLRDFRLIVPSDCSAAEDPNAHQATMKLIETVLKADTTASTELDLRQLKKSAFSQPPGNPS